MSRWSRASTPTSISRPRIVASSTTVERNLNRKYTSYFIYLQQRWAKFSDPHICTLIESLKEARVLKEVIDSGMLLELRRRLTKFVMISRSHPYTSMLFKSINEIRHEEAKHLLNNRYMIHPFSKFCLYYKFVMSLALAFYLGYILPADIHYRIYYPSIKWLKFAFDMTLTVSLIIDFHIGYVDKDNMCVVMKQNVVARRILKKYFFWDLLSCVPSYLIFLYGFNITSTEWNLMKWLGLFRLVRLPFMEHALDMFIKYYKIPAEVYVTIQIIWRSYIVILCCMAVSALLSTFVHKYQDLSEKVDQELAKELIFETIISVIGAGKFEISNCVLDLVSRTFVTIVGLVLHFWIIAKLYILWQRFLVLSEVGEDHYQQLAGYLKYKGLPLQIRKDIYCFYAFKFQNKFYEEFTIYNMLTDNLKKEIPVYRLDQTVDKVKFFRVLPNHIITKIVSNMEALYHCPGDVIFRVNGVSKNLYYIQVGTVALHDEDGTEICHLEDRSYYGDIAVVLKLTHVTTMTALTPCKIFLLKHSVLMQILDPEPEVKESVVDISRLLLMNMRNDWMTSSYKSQRNVTIIEKGKENLFMVRPSTVYV